MYIKRLNIKWSIRSASQILAIIVMMDRKCSETGGINMHDEAMQHKMELFSELYVKYFKLLSLLYKSGIIVGLKLNFQPEL